MTLLAPTYRILALGALLPGLTALAGCGTTPQRLPGPPETFSHRVERDDLPQDGRLVLDAGDCHVRVVHGVARAARFEARLHDLPRAEAEALLHDLRITVRPGAGDASFHDLAIDCPDPDHGPADAGQWTLVLPDGDSATIRTKGGTVDIQALDCNLDVTTVSGPVRIDVVAGDLEVRTSSGRVRLTGPFGRAAIRSGSGAVDVNVPDPDFTAAELSIRTDSGRVALHAAPDDLDELSFVSEQGSVDGNLPLPTRLDPETGSIPAEHTRLRIETRSGDLQLWRLVESRAVSMARASQRSRGSGDPGC